MSSPMDIVILGNTSSFASAILVDAVLKEVKSNARCFRLAGVIDAARQAPPSTIIKIHRKLSIGLLRWMFDHRRKVVLKRPIITTIHAVARKHGISIGIPAGRDINHPNFVGWLNRQQPAVLLSLGCLQIIGRSILDAVGCVVNYHNGALPSYKGLHATAWELYRGESVVGYTYHLVNGKIDTGNVLLRGCLAADIRAGAVRLEYEKAYRAAADVPALLEILRQKAPGEPQVGPGAFFSEKDFCRIRTIDCPQAHTFADLTRRLDCFGALFMRLDHELLMVTRLDRLQRPPAHALPRSFHTKDDVLVRATRFNYLPYGLMRVLRK